MSEFADFFRSATHKEKESVYKYVMDKVEAQQSETIRQAVGQATRDGVSAIKVDSSGGISWVSDFLSKNVDNS